MSNSNGGDRKEDHGHESGKETEAASPPSRSPFERFEDFARKVVSVPKAEIDRRERTYKEKKRKPDQEPSPA